MSNRTILPLAATLLAVVACTPAFGADIHSRAQAVDQHYDQLHSLRADFTETYRGAGMERVESGTLWLKKPGKMRWQYRSPKEKLFLCDGAEAWFYVPGERQVRKTPQRKLDDLRSPLAFLLGKTKLEKELRGLSFAPDVAPVKAGDVVLRGIPNVMGDQVSQVLLEITPDDWINRILVQQGDGSSTEYGFTDLRGNVAMEDQQFRFSPPAGVEVIEGDLGQ